MNLPQQGMTRLQPRKGVDVDEDRIEGKVKEGAGKLTGDEELEKEGQAQDAWGKAKDKADDAKDKADDAWESTKDAVGDAKESLDGRSRL